MTLLTNFVLLSGPTNLLSDFTYLVHSSVELYQHPHCEIERDCQKKGKTKKLALLNLTEFK